jgi:hypothetical protein
VDGDHIHYGPVRGVGVDPEPLLGRIAELEAELLRLREALGLALRFIDTDWEPDDLDRDLVEPLRTALATPRESE